MIPNSEASCPSQPSHTGSVKPQGQSGGHRLYVAHSVIVTPTMAYKSPQRLQVSAWEEHSLHSGLHPMVAGSGTSPIYSGKSLPPSPLPVLMAPQGSRVEPRQHRAARWHQVVR